MRPRLLSIRPTSSGPLPIGRIATFALLALTACAPPQMAPKAAPPRGAAPLATREAAERELASLLADDWEARLREEPTFASQRGDARFAAAWDDESPAAYERKAARIATMLARVRAIEPPLLSEPSRLNAQLFERKSALAIEAHQLGVELLAISDMRGPQGDADVADALHFTDERAFADWNARLVAYPARLAQLTELLRAGLRRRVVPSRAAMSHVAKQLAAQLAADPAKSPFHAPYDEPSSAIPKQAWERREAEARAAIASNVNPSLKAFLQFFETEYFPAGAASEGLGGQPGGAARYAYFVRLQTTTALTPEAIHNLGLAEVARLRDEMARAMGDAHFRGTLPDFFELLRTEPRFYETDPQKLLARYQAAIERAEGAIARVVTTAPPAPLKVVPVTGDAAEGAPAAMYRAAPPHGQGGAALIVNASHLESRPTWEVPTLALHEGVPGHHLQIAIARRQSEIPNFRKYTSYLAFAEGWALYAESLGDELGLLDDPYARFGKLSNEMWRAVRLVVDTGIHAFGWSRARAIAYFLENTPRPEAEAAREVDRYIALPGQALAYKVGELAIRDARRRASEALGAAFDLRAFHDAVLAGGAVPLDVLQARIDAWTVAQTSAQKLRPPTQTPSKP